MHFALISALTLAAATSAAPILPQDSVPAGGDLTTNDRDNCPAQQWYHCSYSDYDHTRFDFRCMAYMDDVEFRFISPKLKKAPFAKPVHNAATCCDMGKNECRLIETQESIRVENDNEVFYPHDKLPARAPIGRPMLQEDDTTAASTTPEITTPEAPTHDTQTPEITTPETPETSVPESSTPESSLPANDPEVDSGDLSGDSTPEQSPSSGNRELHRVNGFRKPESGNRELHRANAFRKPKTEQVDTSSDSTIGDSPEETTIGEDNLENNFWGVGEDH